MAKEYIEREALIQQMADNFRQGVWDGCDCGEYQIAETTILCAPAADVVEVPTDATDDLNRAVIGLGVFRLSFCLNVEKSDSENNLVFRCVECPFEDKETRKCSVKVFLNRYATKEDKQRFSPVV